MSKLIRIPDKFLQTNYEVQKGFAKSFEVWVNTASIDGVYMSEKDYGNGTEYLVQLIMRNTSLVVPVITCKTKDCYKEFLEWVNENLERSGDVN